MRAFKSNSPATIWRGVLVYIQVLLLLFLGVLLPVFSNNHYVDETISFYCLLIGGIFLWSLWSWRSLTGRLFDPYTIFLIAAFLFNAGQALLEIFGLNTNGILDNRFTSETILNTLTLVTIGLLAFHFGGLVGAGSKRNQEISSEIEPAAKLVRNQALYVVGWILLCIAFIPSLIQLGNAINIVLKYGYFALFQREAGTGFDAAPQVLATFLMPAAMFMLAGSSRRSFSKFISLLLVLLYTLTELFLGHRATAIPAAVAYIWLWHRVIKPLPKSVLLTAIAIGLVVVIPLVRVIRTVPGQERMSISYLLESYTSIDNPLVEAVSEMGGSMGTVAYTLQLIPSARDFDYGVDYLYATFTVVPNFFGSLHPTVARGTPGTWLIQTVDPYTAARGGGLGYSFIAEAYFNFGWLGTPLVLGLIGFLFAKFTSWAEVDGEFGRLAVLASFMAFFLFYVRSDSASVFRPLIWYSLFPYVLSVRLARSIRARMVAASGLVAED